MRRTLFSRWIVLALGGAACLIGCRPAGDSTLEEVSDRQYLPLAAQTLIQPIDYNHEIGDLLFAVVNLARKASLDAETALQAATDKFVARFNRLEDELQARGKQLGDVDLAQLDAIWDAIKEKAPNIEHPRPNAELL